MTTDTVSLDQLMAWLARFRELVSQQQGYLTELDSAIGDADHGSNMTRGMTAVMEKIGVSHADGTQATLVDELFKSVGMTLVTSVGGASGPLYGTFFLRMGTTAGPVATLDGAALSAALRAGGVAEVRRVREALAAVDRVELLDVAGDALLVGRRQPTLARVDDDRRCALAVLQRLGDRERLGRLGLLGQEGRRLVLLGV